MTVYRMDGLDAWAKEIEGRIVDVVTEGGIEVQRSVVEGSEITSAPGQPVDTGNLKGSFIPERVSDLVWETTTNVEYAEAIENGVGAFGALMLRSQVGGFHSIALTRGGWTRIMDKVVERVVPQ